MVPPCHWESWEGLGWTDLTRALQRGQDSGEWVSTELGAKVVSSPKTTEGAAIRGKNKNCQSPGILNGEYRVRMKRGREQTLMLTRSGATGEEDKPKHSDINLGIQFKHL